MAARRPRRADLDRAAPMRQLRTRVLRVPVRTGAGGRTRGRQRPRGLGPRRLRRAELAERARRRVSRRQHRARRRGAHHGRAFRVWDRARVGPHVGARPRPKRRLPWLPPKRVRRHLQRDGPRLRRLQRCREGRPWVDLERHDSASQRNLFDRISYTAEQPSVRPRSAQGARAVLDRTAEATFSCAWPCVDRPIPCTDRPRS
jgi:hypothetical protein